MGSLLVPFQHIFEISLCWRGETDIDERFELQIYTGLTLSVIPYLTLHTGNSVFNSLSSRF